MATRPAPSDPSFPGLETSPGLKMAQVSRCPGVFSPLSLKASNSKQRPAAMASLSRPRGHISPKPSKAPAIPPISNGYHCNSATFALQSQAKDALQSSPPSSPSSVPTSPQLCACLRHEKGSPRAADPWQPPRAGGVESCLPVPAVYHKRFHSVSDILGLQQRGAWLLNHWRRPARALGARARPWQPRKLRPRDGRSRATRSKPGLSTVCARW